VQPFLEAHHHCEQAGVLFSLRRYEQAAERYGQALAVEPDHVPALDGLAACYLNLDRAEEAEPVVFHLLRLRPDDARVCYLAASMYLRLGWPGKARTFIDEAIGYRPEADYFALKARIFYLRRQYFDARLLAREGLKLQPDHVGCREIDLAARYDAKRSFRKQAEALLGIAPESAKGHYFLGKSYFFDHRLEKALGHLREAVRLDPAWTQARLALNEAELAQDESAWERLGRVLENAGRSSRWALRALPTGLVLAGLGLVAVLVSTGLSAYFLGGLVLFLLLILALAFGL
jgi:tetratricopeptide (TPR) repeat protein